MTKNGNILASIGGLLAIFSLTVIEDSTWKIIASVTGTTLAIFGAILIQKANKKNKL
ncbi:MAG: hypothetical protein KDC69_10570 [Flavobacteriaceae bacterium]|nr:hypothetical protein [Flavobacteriaceae bacterium]MCB0706435.1 hypothetical protein [Saprospiraceae bacterium]